MRRIVLLLAFCAVSNLSATPIKGGYLGHRILLCGEMSYAPNYTKWTDLLTSYNLQYGGNLSFVTGRYSQIGVSYNMYRMGAHTKYDTALTNSNKIQGFQAGLSWRKFREKRGGLAPIGKFFDFGLQYESATYIPSFAHIQTFAPESVSKKFLNLTVAAGTQGVFWDHVVANTGVRCGLPVYELAAKSNVDTYREYLAKRMTLKNVFSVFFGVGIII